MASLSKNCSPCATKDIAISPLVVDASIVAAAVLEDERPAAAERTFAAIEVRGAVVPDLFRHELRNLLLRAERRGRIRREESAAVLERVQRLSVRVGKPADDNRLMVLARRHGLTAYDAAYLELAQRETLPLATLDQPLAQAAAAEGVVLED